MKGKGQATIHVNWPIATRLIPASAQSLVVTVRQGETPVATMLVRRPDASGTLTGLPYGDLKVDVRAYPNPDGTGVAQAAGAGASPMVVTEDTPGTVAVSLASTVAKLNVEAIQVASGLTKNVSVSAQDADGAIVPIGSESINWTTGDEAIATVSGSGPTATVTGSGPGSTFVRASMVVNDGQDKVSGDGAVSVEASGTLSISPSSAQVTWTYFKSGGSHGSSPTYTYLGASPQSIRFSATLTGDLAGTGVIWSGGPIDANGVYTSASGAPFHNVLPATATVKITAKSVQDPRVKATATVTYVRKIL